MARMGIPRTLTLVVANQWERIAEENLARIRYLLQNRGPGVVYLAPNSLDVQATTGQPGIRLASNDVFIDDPPCVHQGHLWVLADAASTIIVLTEWT
jgi:hypothetical protein